MAKHKQRYTMRCGQKSKLLPYEIRCIESKIEGCDREEWGVILRLAIKKGMLIAEASPVEV